MAGRQKKTEVRAQYMLPRELQQERERSGLVFLPVGPLEWHGHHLPIGVDALNAESTAIAVANRIGGVVLPTLYLGTERERPPQVLRSLGIDENAYVVGMDFPSIDGLYDSFYLPQEVFALVLRNQVQACVQHAYSHIFIVNGHGADNHNEVLRRLCAEFNHETKCPAKVDFSLAFPQEHLLEDAIGHASAHETSVMMHLFPERVDISMLPSDSLPLEYRRYGIVDSGGFSGNPGDGHAVPSNDDPRQASSPEAGRRLFETTVEELVTRVRKFAHME